MARNDNITLTCTKSGFTFTGTPDEAREFFYRDKSQKSGFSPWCKAAEKAYNKAYYSGLKKVKAQKKAAIGTPKALKTFEAEMSSERVARKRKDGTRTPQAKARATAKRTARKVKAKA